MIIPDHAFANYKKAGEYLQYADTNATNNMVAGVSGFTATNDAHGLLEVSLQVNQDKRDCPSGLQEWTPKLENKFLRLAERKALSQLSIEEKVDFEKFAALRQQLKNPRSGEEVLAEYEQRLLTKKLVEALTEYVNFHQRYASHHSR